MTLYAAPRFHKSESADIGNRAAVAVFNVSDPDGTPTWVDETTDFNDAGDADYLVFPASEAIGDYACWGFEQQFQTLIFDNAATGTAGIGGVGVWEYWNGTSWASLETGGFTDGTSDFTIAIADGQTVTWDFPSDWARRSLNGSINLFWVRFRITTVYSTNPVYDQGFVSGDHKVTLQSSALYVGAVGDVVVRYRGDEADRTHTIAVVGDPAYLWGDFSFVRQTGTTASGLVMLQEV
jgi:hypothetical protein